MSLKALIAVACIVVASVAITISLLLLPRVEVFQSIVIFRNDDIQPWFAFDRLVQVNDIFIEEAVPVTLSVIPFIGNHTLGEDHILVDYLKSLKRTHPELFEITLHGYNHQMLSDFYGGSEFGGIEYPNQYGRIILGKKSLKDTLNVDPVTFIPPYGTYDNNTVLALKELGFKAVSGSACFTEAYYNRTEPFMMHEMAHVPESQGFVMNWQNHAFYTLNFLKTRFNEFYETGLVYIQMIHYFTFTSQEKLDQLRDFIGFIRSHEKVEFMTLRSFAEAYLKGRIRRTAEGWKVSPLMIEFDLGLEKGGILCSETALFEPPRARKYIPARSFI